MGAQHTDPNEARTRLNGIEQMRVFAAISVVFIHVPQLDTFARNADIFARWAVPFFFATAGFLAAGSVRSVSTELGRVGSRIVLPYLFWTTIYSIFLTDINTLSIKDLARIALFGGNAIHLWFLPALAIALIAYRLLQGCSALVLILVGIILYIAGLTIGAYPVIDVELPFNPRNGPFLSVPMVFAGAIYRRASQITLNSSLILLLSSFVLYALEIFILAPVKIDQIMTTVLIGFTPLCVAVKLHKYSQKIADLGKYTLGFYLVHVGVITILQQELYPDSIITYLAFVTVVTISSFFVAIIFSNIPYLRATV